MSSKLAVTCNRVENHPSTTVSTRQAVTSKTRLLKTSRSIRLPDRLSKSPRLAIIGIASRWLALWLVVGAIFYTPNKCWKDLVQVVLSLQGFNLNAFERRQCDALARQVGDAGIAPSLGALPG